LELRARRRREPSGVDRVAGVHDRIRRVVVGSTEGVAELVKHDGRRLMSSSGFERRVALFAIEVWE
jgi:hypothetical protein